MIRGLIPPWLNPGLRRRRLERLIRLGRVVELDELRHTLPLRVVAIDLRFGREHWALDRPDVALDETGQGLADGRLVVRDRRPVRSRNELERAGLRVEPEFIRFSRRSSTTPRKGRP